jgi:glycosyltransferase involved in cell wall biosynthesis
MKVYYYCPNLNHPSGGMGVLFKQAKILADNGYDVTLIYEGQGELNPTWMDFDISYIPKVKINGVGSLRIDSKDLLVIPEGFGNIIDSTKNMKFKRVVLAQSWIYILNSMPQPKSWKESGITEVITPSPNLKNYLDEIMPGLNVQTYNYSVNTTYFNKNIQKQPRICFSARGQESEMKVMTIINMFKVLSPKFKHIPFLHLRGYDKPTFAKLLSESTFTLYTDEIACVATLPLESMAANTHVIGWDMGVKDYAVDNENMFMVTNGDCLGLAKKLKEVVEKYFNDELEEQNLFSNYEKTLSLYTEEQEKNRILNIFETYK